MVHSFFILAAAMASSAAAHVAPLLAERQASTTCSALHLMVAGGCALPCTTDSLGLLSTTISNITTAIPGSDLYLVPYDGSELQGAISTQLMIEAANQYAVECPSTPIVFVGYSLGGIIVTNTLCGGINYNPNVIASITYGEETFVYPTSYDRGTCMHNAPKYARSNQAACEPFAPVMQSYCDDGDPQCCAGGFVPLDHFQYAQKYDLAALAFVESQYNAFAASHPTLSSSTSTSASASTSMPTSTNPSSYNAGSTTTSTFNTMPIYGNYSTSPAQTTTAQTTTGPAPMLTSSTVTTVIGGTTTTTVAVAPAMSTSTVTTVTEGTTITTTVVVALTSTIPMYSPSNLAAPTTPATGIPLTGVALPSSAIPTEYQYSMSPDTAVPVPTYAMTASSGVMPGPSGTGLTPFNPNAASSLAISGLLFVPSAVLAWALLL